VEVAMSKREKVTLAAVQASPVFLDRDATVSKACALIAEAGREGANLVVFPESFIPTYPDWVWAIPAGESGLLADLYARFLENSVDVPSAATDKLCQAARRAKTNVVMGLSERNAEASGASMYNSLLYIGADGSILGKHRKLVPTGGERLVWAQGDGSTLAAYDTSVGKLGGLICWENYMPLARYAMFAWGTQIYVAATWDRGEPWLSTIRHIAKEGGVFVVSACIPLRKDDIPNSFEFKQKYYGDVDQWINVGDSAIVDPTGDFIAGPIAMQEAILYAEVDLQRARGSKWMLDVAGHYARPDVFELVVHDDPRPMITVESYGTGSDGIAPASGLKQLASRQVVPKVPEH
jgi:nitrilase